MQLKPFRLAICICVAFFSSIAFGMDCKLASTAVDRLICGNPDLLAADRQLNEAYQIDLSAHDDPKSIVDEQRYWLKSRRNRCADATCLTDAYQKRLTEIRSTVDCTKPANENETLVCSAHNEQELAKLIAERWNEWRPYLGRRHDLPSSSRWDDLVNTWMTPAKTHCLTLDCKRAETAQKLEEFAFPKEVYEKFLTWIDSNGQRSPFLDSDRWTLNDSEAEPLWKHTSDGQIVYIGDLPAWLQSRDEDNDRPRGQAPFLNRRLTAAEASNLRQMIFSIRQDSLSSTWLRKESIAGISLPILNSVFVSDGSSAHCSSDPRFSSIAVQTMFPPNENDTADKRFKIIELVPTPIDRPIPHCSMEDGSESFFNGDSRSDIVVNDVVDQALVRPDGTFWLKLANDRWVRFRRDMTTDAKGISPPFFVLSEREFNKMLDASKTMADLDALLKRRFSSLHTK